MGTPPPLCALVRGLLVGWLLVFRLLVGCWVGWLVVGQLSLAGWLVVWLVAWLVGCWLVAGVYVCVLPRHMLCGVVAHCVCV